MMVSSLGVESALGTSLLCSNPAGTHGARAPDTGPDLNHH